MTRKILCLVLVLTLLPYSVLATQNDFIIDDGVLAAYSGPGGVVVIPDGVTAIAYGAFDGCASQTKLIIPDSVTQIGDWTFSGCTGLSSVTIGNGVTRIGKCAFQDCTNLTEVTIGSSVTSIGEYAFSGCSNLTGVTIPDSVTKIEKGAFYECSKLTDATISDSVTSMGDSTFSYCESLTGVTIPDGVTRIGSDAFSYCINLTSVTIPDSVTSIGDNAFSLCNSLSDVTIPSSVTDIGYGAFESCTSLRSITIPGSVTSIGRAAFWNCSSLESIVFAPGVQEIDVGVFGYCLSLQDITIPSSVTILCGSLFAPDYDNRSQIRFHVAAGSLAEGYAQTNGIAYVADQPSYMQSGSEQGFTTAYASTQTVEVYRRPVVFQMYGLKDTNGYMTNYIRLRDLAYALPKGHSFNVTWSDAVGIERGVDYVPNGSEMSTPFNGDRPCIHQNTDVLTSIFGTNSLDSILLTDNSGGGYTYFKLRELCDLIGIAVDWDSDKGITIGY